MSDPGFADTIFALSSGQPPAAIAIVRISGPAAFGAVERLAGKLPAPRRASLRALRQDGETLDHALVVIFPGPATATGEDLAELHLHGGRAVVRAVEAALSAMAGLRPAEPGEFTRRALAHGRIGLTEAEGLADFLAAETEGQRRAAVRAAEGGIRRLVEGWAARALQLSAAVEAMLDHADEDDVEGQGDAIGHIAAQAGALAQAIVAIVAQPGVERLRDGLRVVLAGPPNAGKSTLLNALAGRDAAIVSPLAGTTRDRIEVPVMRDGVAYLLIDTAGLHERPADVVEQLGIDRARESLTSADLVLWLDDLPPPDAASIWLNPRADLPGRSDVPDRLSVSALTGLGIDRVWQVIAERASALLPPLDSTPLNARQRQLAAVAADALDQAAGETDILLLAEQLRRALRAFHQITGAADVEAMLDSLFGRFCIGK
ncbi:tRNA uridine-5-carboxymethylaminomethyl(34) synthesis GTPase MnmE [Sphingomonas sp. MG17]|uniref:tRNA modification GTPase MnmE n=1 Tax=Sphingomonas tagetis TaxID=2949092 RepID=A0A9X2KMC7_9SPHN|nr:tRNA uridine-5-carboxymethylaminomethyl(34) synthesis GTPase MnmE [Sphingomonas tagetis]